MSFISSIVINMLEKELTAQSPEIEAYALQFIGHIASDLVQYVEKKIRISTINLQNQTQTPQSIE